VTRLHKRVVGLGRHAGTEVAGVGASPGTHFLFSTLEASLRRHFSLVCVPPYYYSMDARRSIVIAADVLDAVDACVFGLPPHPVDLDAFFVVRAHMRKRVPFVYMPLGEFPRGASTYRRIHEHLTPDDLIVFSSRADKAIHDSLVESTAARTEVTPFGIRTSHFRPSPRSRAEARRQLGLGDEAVVFVSHGRVIAEKNVHASVMMFRRVAADHPGTYLWIIGALPDEDRRGPGPRPVSELAASRQSALFRQLLCGTGLEDRVIFWGGVSYQALPQVLGAADVAVNLTVYEDENFGYSAVEAMACGLPVIGTHWGGLKDTVAHGETGFLVPTVVTPIGVGVDHWRAWRYAVQLVEDGGLRRRMARAARRRVLAMFTLDRFSRDVAAEIRASIARPRTASGRRHSWSPLGKRLTKRYSTNHGSNGARAFATSIPQTPAKFIEHPLLLETLKPYATRTQRAKPDGQAVYFLTTDLIDVRRARVSFDDPRYTANVTVSDGVDHAIVRLLKRRGFCGYQSLIEETAPRWSARAVRASLRQLLKTGVVLQSGTTESF
jgi:glycosyltransferase involved in cell wall biosynthesis